MPKRTVENWMWMEACEVLDRAARLQRQFFRPTFFSTSQPVWEPPIDIYETAQGYSIVIALPGVPVDQIVANFQDGNLIIEGHRRLPAGGQVQIKRLEIPYGRFKRVIDLPAGNYQVTAREYTQGCLLISLLKM